VDPPEVHAYDDSQTAIGSSYTLLERLRDRALSDAPHVSARFYDRT
jgi:hypothetical protein